MNSKRMNQMKLVRHVEAKLQLKIRSLAKFKAVYEEKDQRGMGRQSKTEDCDQKRRKNNIPCFSFPSQNRGNISFALRGTYNVNTGHYPLRYKPVLYQVSLLYLSIYRSFLFIRLIFSKYLSHLSL